MEDTNTPQEGTGSEELSSAAAEDIVVGLLDSPEATTEQTNDEAADAPTDEADPVEETAEEVDEEAPQNDDEEAEEDGEEPKPELAADTEEEGADEAPEAYVVKVDGEEFEVTLDELRGGYQRQSDYTRKMQSHADERKAFQADVDAAKAELQAGFDRVAQMAATFDQTNELGPEPDWVTIAKEDPLGYPEQREQWNQKRASFEQKAAAAQEVQQAQAQQMEAQKAAYVADQAEKLLLSIPEWSDDAVKEAEGTNVTSYLSDVGYSNEELSQLYDHRAVGIARKAMLYDKLMANQEKVKQKAKKAPKVVKPGVAQRKSNGKADAAAKRFSRTGSEADAVALAFESL